MNFDTALRSIVDFSLRLNLFVFHLGIKMEFLIAFISGMYQCAMVVFMFGRKTENSYFCFYA
ncbi:hypothetical protein HMPREF1989_02291 [Porphyromonas gingivalis F0566]|nr:hypothetical protein HMPREF1989_02291 [Porphyromonas gingivalis F0566]